MPTLFTDSALMKEKKSIFRPSPLPVARPRVSIVEDSPELGKPLAVQLHNAGYETTRVLDGTSGLTIIRRTRPNVVILDLASPLVDGIPFVESLLALPSAPSIIFLTTDEDSEAQAAMKERGVSEVFIKPIDNREIIDCIDALTHS